MSSIFLVGPESRKYEPRLPQHLSTLQTNRLRMSRICPVRGRFQAFPGSPLVWTAVGSDQIDLHAELAPRRIGVDSQLLNFRGSSAALSVPGRRGLIKVERGNLAEPLVNVVTGDSRYARPFPRSLSGIERLPSKQRVMSSDREGEDRWATPASLSRRCRRAWRRRRPSAS